MNKKEKTLALANLMKYDLYRVTEESNRHYIKLAGGNVIPFEPYEDTRNGLAQFATILLKHPKAIMHYTYDRDKSKWLSAADGEMFHGEPTQASILDEILRMNEGLE